MALTSSIGVVPRARHRMRHRVRCAVVCALLLTLFTFAAKHPVHSSIRVREPVMTVLHDRTGSMLSVTVAPRLRLTEPPSTPSWVGLLEQLSQRVDSDQRAIKDENPARVAADRGMAEAYSTAETGERAAEEAVDPREAQLVLSELSSMQFQWIGQTIPNRPSGLCVFVPIDASDSTDPHIAEVVEAMEAWGEAGVVAYVMGSTEVAVMLSESVANRRGVAVVSATEATDWIAGHRRRVLSRSRLRQRGSTPAQLRGRGELSLPLWRFLWRERDSPALAQCLWFMKADSDAFVNLRQMDLQLSAMRPGAPQYVGTSTTMSTEGFNAPGSPAESALPYHLGGPGYTLSRGLLESVDWDVCFQHMSLDPIWLVHDDAAVGFCAQKHSRRTVELLPWADPVTGTSVVDVARAIEGAIASARLRDSQYYAWLFGEPPLVLSALDCLLITNAIHPLTPATLRALALFSKNTERRRAAVENHVTAGTCSLVLMAGRQPLVGGLWQPAVRSFLQMTPLSPLPRSTRRANLPSHDPGAWWSV
jgi:hypothetical protein